jgi:hypothetical protein
MLLHLCRTCGADIANAPNIPGVTAHMPGCADVRLMLSSSAPTVPTPEPAPAPAPTVLVEVVMPGKPAKPPCEHCGRQHVAGRTKACLRGERAANPTPPCPHCGAVHRGTGRTVTCLLSPSRAGARPTVARDVNDAIASPMEPPYPSGEVRTRPLTDEERAARLGHGGTLAELRTAPVTHGDGRRSRRPQPGATASPRSGVQ